MSLKEKFQKAGLTETKVKMPEAKITDENGDKQTYKISRKSQKLVNQYQSRNGKVVNTPGAMVKGASFASKREKRKVRQTKALDAVEKRAGSAIASGNAGILSGNAKNISVLANAIAKSRKNAENVRTPVAATKGSVFANKGYNPQKKAKSASETKRLETTAQKADAFARRMQAKEAALDTEGKEGLGKVGRTAYDLGKVGTQLAADATAGLLVPGGGLASVASRSFGQGVMQAEDEGKSGARAVLYGAGNAAIEAGTEKLTAAAKPLKAIYGAGVVDPVLGKLTKKLGSSAKGRSVLATIAKAAGGEAAEEALADVLQVPLQRAVLENGAKFDADWAANTVYDALLGGVMGGVLGGGSVAVDRAQNRSTNSAKVMADAMQRARERNQKKAAGNAPPMMQNRGVVKRDTPTQQATAQNLPAQNINVNRQQNTTAQEPTADPVHIDNRSSAEISSRKVHAFQYDHPEIRQYYREAAEDLLTDADLSLQSGTTRRKERTMQGNKRVQEIIASPIVRQAMSHGLTRENIIRGAEDIIQDEGAENNANAKRVEQVLDRMVEQGYRTMVGRTVQPNAAYVAAKQAIPGGAQRTAAGSWEAYLEENRLPLETGEVTEAQLRAEYEALQRGGGSGTMNANGGAGYGREGQVPESRGFAGQPGREMPERGEIDPRGILGGIRSDGNSVRNENAGRFSLAQQYGIQGNDGGINYGGETRGADQSGYNTAEGRRTDEVVRGTSGEHEIAKSYKVNLSTVPNAEIAARGHKYAYSRDSKIFISDTTPEPLRRQVVYHEIAHTMKQSEFDPYLQFIPRVETMLVDSEKTRMVLNNLIQHRNLQGENGEIASDYDSLSMQDQFTVLDELNAVVIGGYKSDPENTIGLLQGVMKDPESYVSELSDIMEQYKARNDGQGTADQQMGNSVGSAKSAFPVERKVSQYRLNTLEKTLTPEELEQIKNTDFSYQVLPDAQVLDEARNRISYQERDADGNLHTVYDIEPEMDALRSNYMWNAEDVVTAGMIAKQLKTRAYDSGNWAEYNKWEKEVQNHATELGQALRSFRLYQTDGEAVTAKAADVLEKSQLPEDERNAVQSEIQSHIDAIEKAGESKESLIDQIESIARRRGTTKRGLTGVLFGKDKGLSKKVRKYLSGMDYDTLKSKALLSAENIAADYTKRSLGEKAKTIQVMNQLGNLITFERNIGGNTAFGIQDATSDSMAAALDIILSKATGTRSQEFNTYFANKGQRAAATKAMQNAVVDIALDIDEISENRYGITSGRTFKMKDGPMMRFLSTVEKYLSYSLTASDEFYKGGARAGVEQGLRKLYESGKLNIPNDQQMIDGMENPDVEKYIRQKADEKAKYVTFQDNSALANFTQYAHDLANKVGIGKRTGQAGMETHAFGLGDLLMPYAKVPGNLGSRAIEYSPVGVAKGAAEIFQVLADAKRGTLDINKQRKAVQDVARGVNGTALWAVFAALALKGLMRNADDQNDADVAALNAAEGMNGTQINLDAAVRALNGESAEWRRGDTLAGISFLEPLNAAMAAGTMLAGDLQSDATQEQIAADSVNKALGAILDIPVMQTVNDLYTNMSYGNGLVESVRDAALSSVASTVTPALLRQAAKAGDNNYRDVYSSDTTRGQMTDKVKQNIPGLRQQLPKKLDNFGREKTYTDNQTLNIINALISPGSINTYKQSGLSKKLETLGDPSLYPDRSAPKSVSVDNEDIALTYPQRQKFQKIRGGKSYTTMNAMTKTDIYKSASKEEKIELLSECNKYANAIAKDEVVDKFELSTKYQNASKADDPAQWLAEAYVYGTVDGDIDQNAKAAVEQYGMNLDRYREIKKTMWEFRADKDANGETIDGTCKAKVINYLKQQGLTSEQYYFLYHSKYKK